MTTENKKEINKKKLRKSRKISIINKVEKRTLQNKIIKNHLKKDKRDFKNAIASEANIEVIKTKYNAYASKIGISQKTNNIKQNKASRLQSKARQELNLKLKSIEQSAQTAK